MRTTPTLAAKLKSKPTEPFRVEAHSLGLKPGIDPNKLNQLVDELEVQEYAARKRRFRKSH